MKELLDVVTRIYEYQRPYPALVGTASGLETVRLGSIANPWYPRHPRRAASIVAMLIFLSASLPRRHSLPCRHQPLLPRLERAG